MYLFAIYFTELLIFKIFCSCIQLSEDELETINGLTYLDTEPYSDRPGSSGGAANNCRTSAADHHQQRGGYSEAAQYHPQIQSVLLTSSNSTKPSTDTSPRPDKPTFKCTYPGCTAVCYKHLPYL